MARRRNKASDFRREVAISLLGLARVLGVESEELFRARNFVSGKEQTYSYMAMQEDVGTLKRYAQLYAHGFESGVREGLRVPAVPKDYRPLLLDIIRLAQKIGIQERELYAHSILGEVKSRESKKSPPYYGLDLLRRDFDAISLGLSLILHDRESLAREIVEEGGRNLGNIEIPSNSVTLESEISNRHSRTKGDTINGNVYNNLNQGYSKRDEEIEIKDNEIKALRERVERLEKENDALLDSRQGNGWLEEQIGFEEIVPLRK